MKRWDMGKVSVEGTTRSELDKILASDGFATADSLSRFLRFVVDQALTGQGDRIKEYVIGVQVFGRGESFDPRADPKRSVVMEEIIFMLYRKSEEQVADRPERGALAGLVRPEDDVQSAIARSCCRVRKYKFPRDEYGKLSFGLMRIASE